MQGFRNPLNHINFQAKQLFGSAGRIIDGTIAYLESNGGGPVIAHTHRHSHLLTVIQGELKIIAGDRKITVEKNESYLLQGNIPHSVWNSALDVTIIVDISVEEQNQ